MTIKTSLEAARERIQGDLKPLLDFDKERKLDQVLSCSPKRQSRGLGCTAGKHLTLVLCERVWMPGAM